ncbi:SNF2 family N-terminal domain-containing protein [Mycena floridula]|nr:SNF2 family N-terminal domain-containing protein [Mycena floridula]
MARTRRAAKQADSPSTATTVSNFTGNPSPAFSVPASAVDTPATTDIDEDVLPIPKAKRQTKVKPRGKRAAKSDTESDSNSVAQKPAAKRRAVGENRAFVVVPQIKSNSKKLPAAVRNGKAAIKSSGPPTDDDELVSDDELEYNERAGADDTGSSGSEFVASSDDEGPVQDEDEDAGEEGPGYSTRSSPRKLFVIDSDEDMDVDDEDIMMDAAIQLSLLQGRRGSSQASGSSRPTAISPNPLAALRAAAAEKRIARANKSIDIEDVDIALSSDEDSDSEPIAKKTKGKGKGKAPAKTKAKGKTPDVVSTIMTIAEMRRQKKEARSKLLAERQEAKKEEMALRLKLGRKLTHAEKTTIALHKNHPELKNVWGDLETAIPIVVPTKADQPTNVKLTLLPFQREGLFWMKKQEQGIWHGGMLADEMGMGKTIQIIALLVSDNKKPSLVVAPTVAIMQWRNEIEAHTDGLKVLVWHGQGRENDIKELKKYDVVLTTYAVLESSFRKQQNGFKRKGMIVKEKSAVHEIKWNRIILDEAHNIKERSTNTAKAAFELKANYRWCLSGTPLQNRVGELYSLVRFLGGDPFSYYFCKKCDCKSLHWKFSDKKTCDDCGHSPMQHTCFWNTEILTPIQKNGMEGPGKPAFKKLRILLDRMMLRRTKLQRSEDLGLPPRTVIVRRDYFSPEEKELYLSLFSDAKRQFATYLDQGTILNNYSNIFSLLTRMRQMACHPDLVLRSKTNAAKFIQEEAGEATVCRICNDIAEDAIQSKCRHIFDRECIKQYLTTALEQNPACPVCHLPLTIDLEAPALELEANLPSARQGILGRLNLDTWRSSSKIEALVEELSELRMQDSTTKSLVFSQFVNFLDLIAYRLQKAGFNICRLEGTMSPQARDATIKHFMNNVGVTVFLVSLKAGGVALNLTEASRVYLMDSWWNPAVEYQAMDRIHRLGQHRPVKAIKLVVEDSIESRIVQLQEKKSAMVDATLSTDDSAMGRLTPEDLGFLFRL